MNMRTQKWISKSGRTEATMTKNDGKVLSVRFGKAKVKKPTPPRFPGAIAMRAAA